MSRIVVAATFVSIPSYEQQSRSPSTTHRREIRAIDNDIDAGIDVEESREESREG